MHLVSLVRCGNQTCTERFAENQKVSRPRAALCQDMVWMYCARNRKPVFRLFIRDGMPTCNDCSGLRNHISAALEDLTQQSRFQVVWPRHKVNGHKDLSTHRVYIAHSISGGDCSKGVRVINDRRKEVRRANDRLCFVHTIDGSIVGFI